MTQHIDSTINYWGNELVRKVIIVIIQLILILYTYSQGCNTNFCTQLYMIKARLLFPYLLWGHAGASPRVVDGNRPSSSAWMQSAAYYHRTFVAPLRHRRPCSCFCGDGPSHLPFSSSSGHPQHHHHHDRHHQYECHCHLNELGAWVMDFEDHVLKLYGQCFASVGSIILSSLLSIEGRYWYKYAKLNLNNSNLQYAVPCFPPHKILPWH